MDEHYSNLEHIRHDETARAPERDYDATAFELDASALAPQTVSDTAPQVFYNTSAPEVFDKQSTTGHAPSLHVVKPALKRRLMVMALVVAAAIAIGTGIGIWRSHLSYRRNATASSPAPQNPNITSNPNNIHVAQYILNDTSLAALSLSNGDRHLFFQDNTGLIRRVVRTASNNKWSMSQGVSVLSNAKKYTPLAVIFVGSAAETALYYVSESHVLSSTLGDSWGSLSSPNYSTAEDTRSLSITWLGNTSWTTNSVTYIALLLYENPAGKVSVLSLGYNGTVYLWVDITDQGSNSLPVEFHNNPHALSRTLYESDAKATFRSPFTSATEPSGDAVGALIFSPFNPSLVDTGAGDLIYASYSNGTWMTQDNQVEDPSSIHQSDIALFGNSNAFWINGTQPVSIMGFDIMPDNTFPFARLASVTLADHSATFLYHQIDERTFAEEQWDELSKTWSPPEYITISLA